MCKESIVFTYTFVFTFLVDKIVWNYIFGELFEEDIRSLLNIDINTQKPRKNIKE